MSEDDDKKLRLLERMLRLAEAGWKNAKNEDEVEHWKKQHREIVTKIARLTKK